MGKMRNCAVALIIFQVSLFASETDRACCSSSGQIKQIKLQANDIKNSLNDINEIVSGFGCSSAEIMSLTDAVIGISSALDTVTGVGIADCCSDVDQILSFVIGIDSKVENLHPGCCDLVTESIAISSTFESLIDAIQSGPTCCSLVDRMLSSLEALESVVEEVDSHVGCATIPIFTSTTISESGSYCLANDLLPGFIEITAGNVTLNLNGNEVGMDSTFNGIHVTGPGNVIIKNGFVGVDPVTAPAIGTAILVETSHVIIKDIQINGIVGTARPNGIVVSDQNGGEFHDIFINRTTVTNCQVGVVFTNVSRSTITHSSFNFNVDGVILSGCEFNRIDTCVANGNSGDEFFGFGHAFLIVPSDNLTGGNNLLVNCSAANNLTGFHINGSGALLSPGNALIDCTAQSNSEGFDVTSDAQNLQLIKRCIATGNTYGFRHTPDQESVIEYIANVAQVNSTANYDVSTNPTFNTPVDPTIVDPASYWLNLNI